MRGGCALALSFLRSVEFGTGYDLVGSLATVLRRLLSWTLGPVGVCVSTVRRTIIHICRPHSLEFKKEPESTPIPSNLIPEGLSQGLVRKTEWLKWEQRH